MKNRIYAYFDFNSSKQYPVVYGTTYTETFNEEINSFNIVLDNVKEEDRIYFDRPYHFVKIFNDTDYDLEHLLLNNVLCIKEEETWESLPELNVSKTYVYESSDNPFNKTMRVADAHKTFKVIGNYNGKKYIASCYINYVIPAVPGSLHPTIRVNYEVTEYHELKTGLLFNDKNYIIMLVDTFVENLNSFGDEKIYRYEIGLMNCVKLLEKIQCPNLMITHSLVKEDEFEEDSNHYISAYIDRYMQLYSPKVKTSTDGETWSYEYLLNWDSIKGVPNPNYDPADENSSEWLVEPDPIFQVPAADMQMNEPTLREVITNLMSQVACIPKIDYRTLKYINFREEPTDANITDSDGINFIKHSGASDSYASDLMSNPSQALQKDNTVIADIVGFRDSDNALIQQKKNLQLEVRYPIYKINEVRMRTTDNKEGWFKPENENAGNSVPVVLGSITELIDNGEKPWITYKGTTGDEDLWDFDLNLLYAQLTQDNEFHKCKLKGLHVHFCNYVNNKYVEVPVSVGVFGEHNLDLGDSSEDTTVSLSSNKGFLLGSSTESSTYRISITNFRTCNYRWHEDLFETQVGTNGNFTQVATHAWIDGSIEDLETGETLRIFVPMAKIKQRTANEVYYIDIKTAIRITAAGVPFPAYYNNNNTSFSDLYPSNEVNISKFNIPANVGTYIDITPCVVENGKRRLLDVDYTDMQLVINDTSKNLEDLAQYIYGTIGYTIGDNKISSFSDSYTRAQMWWSKEKTYFDVILSFINARRSRLLEFNFEEFRNTMHKQITEYKEACGYSVLVDKGTFHVTMSGDSWDPDYNKMKFLFYIYYQPLNNLKFKATKEGKDFPFAIEQLNSSADGLSDFERVAKNLQDTVNRIGNPVKAIPQTIDDTSKIKPLNSIYNDGHYDFTIFHRQFAIYEDYLTVNYTASENYVIKNYFTSIITKYRAYEYVDYNASVVRKENLKVYAHLSDDHYYDGDDKLRLFNEYYSLNDLARILNVQDISNYISYNDDPLVQLEYSKNLVLQYNFIIYNPVENDLSRAHTKASATENMNLSYTKDNFCSMKTLQYNEEAYNSEAFYFRSSSEYQIYRVVESSTEKCSDKYYSSLFDFVNEEYSNAITNVIKPAQMNVLEKINGSILKDGNNYYRINIIDGTDLSNTVLETDFKINKYGTVNSFFHKLDSIIYKEVKKKKLGSQKFYPNNNVISLSLTNHSFYIQLNEITDATEKTEIIRNQASKMLLLLSGATEYDDAYDYKAKYVIKSSQNQDNNLEETKNEINTLYTDTGFILYYQDYDNISAGPQLFSLSTATDSWNPYAAGGWVQKWQVWDQEIYGLSHQVFFTYNIIMKQPNGGSSIDDYIKQLPVINKGWEYQPYTLFQLVDNNKSSDLRFTFYKDISEILNQSLQIEYYGEDVIFSKFFIEHNRMIHKLEYDFSDSNNMIFCLKLPEGFRLHDKPYDLDWNETLARVVDDTPVIDVDPNNGLTYVEITWPNHGEYMALSMGHRVGTFEGWTDIYDLIGFRRNGRTGTCRYYLTLNDTKTNDVWYFTNPDDLFTIYECANYGYNGDTTGRVCKPKGE